MYSVNTTSHLNLLVFIIIHNYLHMTCNEISSSRVSRNNYNIFQLLERLRKTLFLSKMLNITYCKVTYVFLCISEQYSVTGESCNTYQYSYDIEFTLDLLNPAIQQLQFIFCILLSELHLRIMLARYYQNLYLLTSEISYLVKL